MPAYDYQCKECGHEFEEFQSMKSELLTVCPICKKPALKRLMAGGVGMIFKGSGFYSTDYKKSIGKATSPDKTETKKETKPASSSEKSDSSSSSESKPPPPSNKSDSSSSSERK